MKTVTLSLLTLLTVAGNLVADTSFRGRVNEIQNGQNNADRVADHLKSLGFAAFKATVKQDYGSHNYVRILGTSHADRYGIELEWTFKKWDGRRRENNTEAKVRRFIADLDEQRREPGKWKLVDVEGPHNYVYLFYLAEKINFDLDADLGITIDRETEAPAWLAHFSKPWDVRVSDAKTTAERIRKSVAKGDQITIKKGDIIELKIDGAFRPLVHGMNK